MRELYIKNTKNNYYLLFFFCAFICTLSSFAQKLEKKELEERKKDLQKEIEYTNQLLNETKRNKKISLNQLVTLNKKISVREELINTISYEIGIINRQVRTNANSVDALQKDLKKLKDEYAKMVFYAYKNQDAYSRLMFIFSSIDFNQAYMRLKYLQQYNDYRHRQALMIEKTQLILNEKIKLLEEKKVAKKELLTNEELEKAKLTEEKEEKEDVFSKLQDQERQLKKDLEKKKKDAEKLQKAIQRIIEDEIKRAKENARNNKTPEPKGIVLTPEAEALSNTFASNKGKLPWPVLQGIITGRFGVHPHPLMPDVDVSNNGIDISTSKGSLARAVFDGEVTGVANIPGSGKVVIIRHGEYLSVYANLNEVYVKTGEKITTKQNIGSVIYDDNDSKTEIHLEIWKGQTKLDPELWLFKNNKQ